MPRFVPQFAPQFTPKTLLLGVLAAFAMGCADPLAPGQPGAGTGTEPAGENEELRAIQAEYHQAPSNAYFTAVRLGALLISLGGADSFTRVPVVGLDPSSVRETRLQSKTHGVLRSRTIQVAGLTSVQDVSAWMRPVAHFQGKRVLSLGEGLPVILSELVLRGVDAYGLDISPEYATLPTRHYQLLRERLIQADATRFSGSPEVQAGFDHVLSMCLVCQLDHSLNEKMIGEGLRVLRRGGEFRIAWCTGGEMRLDGEFIKILERVKEQFEKEGTKLSFGLAELYYDEETAPRIFQVMIRKY